MNYFIYFIDLVNKKKIHLDLFIYWFEKVYKLFFFVLMSNNPFVKFVVDPSKIPDPNTIQAR
jgi:hypothetical protein